MPRHIALLRGINVGGKNKLPMQVLRALLEDLGCTAITTYIQSGNAVFDCSAGKAKTLSTDLAAAIAAELGLQVPVILRTAAQWQVVAKAHPFDADDDAVHVAFLAGQPTAAQVKNLDPNRSPGDAFAVRGREVYMHCPNGFARSKLTNAWLDKSLETISTSRNWQTVQKLAEMVG
jgi:uncharacterized protein (DUF1697 family)